LRSCPIVSRLPETLSRRTPRALVPETRLAVSRYPDFTTNPSAVGWAVKHVHRDVRLSGCQDDCMDPLRVFETLPGRFRLELIAGTTGVDETIISLGHEPNGPFWEGVAELLIRQRPGLDERLFLDSEAGAFSATAAERGPLDELEALLRPATTDAARIVNLIEAAAAAGIRLG
jgi:Immunity protein 51